MTSISSAENLRRLLRGEAPAYMADRSAVKFFLPSLIEDNVARGMVIEAAPFDLSKAGGKDMFGVDWVFDPACGGSMEVGEPPVEDLSRWEDFITFPDLDSYDWEGCAEANRDYLTHDGLTCVWVFTGLFERLISFVGMEDALVALIDEDEQEHVHRLFDRLCVFYAELFARFKRHFNCELIFFHDDWGTQNAPFFSLDTVREMLAPYLKRIVRSAHELGCWVEFHSCGKNEMLVPAMIEAGVDLWDGQELNDFELLHRRYPDFHFQPYAPTLAADATQAEIEAAAEAYVDAFSNGSCICTTRRMPPELASRFTRHVHDYSAKRYQR